MTPPRPGVIRSKVRVPPVTHGSIARPRVLAAFSRAAAGRAVLLISAPAGSGKTTAAAQLVASRPGPVAWLTLGEGDDTPGRLMAYLATAVESVEPGLAETAFGLLADGLSPVDCAATLGERLPPGCAVVIDDIHLVDARAPVLRVLRALIDALAPGALLVLVSRRALHLDLAREVLSGRAAIASADDLLFQEDEIAALLHARGIEGDARTLARRSGGWAAGVVFDALRGSVAPPGAGGDDPFFAYLGSEILDALPADLRGVVVRSGLLSLVSPARLAALLGVPDGARLFARMCDQHLPGVREPDGLRHHPRFREYLLDRLRRDHPGEVPVLLRRYGLALAADGLHEEAVPRLLQAGDRDAAADAVMAAAPALMARGDWERLLEWCEGLGEGTLAGRGPLRGLQVRALLMSRRQEDVAPLVEAMRATGEFDRLLSEAPDAAAWAAWALHGSGDVAEPLRIAPPASATRRAHSVRYILEVISGRNPPPEWAPGEFDRPQPLHVALQSAVYYRGHLTEVERLSWAAAGRGPVTAVLAEIYRVAVLCVRGDLAEARQVLAGAAPRVRASRFVEFWQQVEAELAFAEGDRDAGLHLIREARATSRQHGYRLADRAVFASVEGKMLVRMGRLPEAVELLEATRQWCSRRSLGCFGEWASTWLAAALLLLCEAPARPAALLSDAVRGMRAADRGLELVPALVFTAEAAWRTGDEAGHDAAADAAHAEAVGMGTLGPLVAALRVMPDVLARRLDASPAEDDTWRAVARATSSPAEPMWHVSPDVLVGTMGRSELVVGGRCVPVSPPTVAELAARLARAPAGGVSRALLVDDLVDASADGANYLRQLLHRLRRALPEAVEVHSSDGVLELRPPGSVVAEDGIVEGLVLRARREVGGARRRSLERALEIARRGAYLPQVDGPSARRRRDELAPLVAEAHREYALALLREGRPVDAATAARDAVEADPYREDGWRLLMRARAAAEGPAAALPVFLECSEHLRAIGLEPSGHTRELMARLRG